MNIDELTIKQIKELGSMFNIIHNEPKNQHPMLGKRCVLRTYSAGVHAGIINYVNPENSYEVKLKPGSIRIWRWKDGGLSLSAIAKNGMKGGRTNLTENEIYLTNVIEIIEIKEDAWKTYEKYLED